MFDYPAADIIVDITSRLQSTIVIIVLQLFFLPCRLARQISPYPLSHQIHIFLLCIVVGCTTHWWSWRHGYDARPWYGPTSIPGRHITVGYWLGRGVFFGSIRERRSSGKCYHSRGSASAMVIVFVSALSHRSPSNSNVEC